MSRHVQSLPSAVAAGVLAGLAGPAARRPAQRDLLGSGRVVQSWPTEFEKETGIKTTMTSKGSGESTGELAEREGQSASSTSGSAVPAKRICRRPSWVSTDEYASPMVAQLHPWAQKRAEQSKYRTVGIYARRARHRVQLRARHEEEGSRPRLLEGSRQARIRERRPDGESERIGHRVHGDRDAGAVLRRGRGVQVAESDVQGAAGGKRDAAERMQAIPNAPASRRKGWSDQGDGGGRAAATQPCESAASGRQRVRRHRIRQRRRRRSAGRRRRSRSSRHAKGPATRSARCRSSKERAISTMRRNSSTGR